VQKNFINHLYLIFETFFYFRFYSTCDFQSVYIILNYIRNICNRVCYLRMQSSALRLASAQIARLELTAWFARGKEKGLRGRGGYCKGNRPDFSHPPLNSPRRYYHTITGKKNDPSFPPDSMLASAGSLESAQGFIIVFSLRKSSSWHLRIFECLAHLALIYLLILYI